MIVKKLKRTSFKKSKATMIGGLVDYTSLPNTTTGARTSSPTPEARIF